MFDGKALGETIVAQVREFVGKSVSTLSGRVDALEKRAPVPGPQGERGADGHKGEKGEKGDPVDDAAVRVMVGLEVDRAMVARWQDDDALLEAFVAGLK